ncbi:MAG: hypothetical protein PHI12_13710 [Dehalococcoidales bacterium]|jgi:hypothetical protein|nr:hypothetical protein [Dehalococcoidales bacterium]
MSNPSGIGCECKRHAKHTYKGETIVFAYDCDCIKYSSGSTNGKKMKGKQHMVNISFPTKSQIKIKKGR